MTPLLDITPMTEPDPDWEHNDKEGHKHYWKIIDKAMAVIEKEE